MRLIKTIIFGSAMFMMMSVGLSWAEINPYVYPTDSKIVVFPYSSVQTYRVLTKPNAITDIEVPDNENISAFALGDTVQWVVESTGRHVLVKPIEPGLKTSATLITDRRTYQLILESVSNDRSWYQQVRWNIPNIVFKTRDDKAVSEEARLPVKEDKDVMIDAKNMHLGYRIKGNEKFRPSIVFDDGIKTYFKFDQKVQEYPAFWSYNADGKAEIVNYVILNDGYVAIDRVSDHTVLVLGKRKVHVYREKD